MTHKPSPLNIRSECRALAVVFLYWFFKIYLNLLNKIYHSADCVPIYSNALWIFFFKYSSRHKVSNNCRYRNDWESPESFNFRLQFRTKNHAPISGFPGVYKLFDNRSIWTELKKTHQNLMVCKIIPKKKIVVRNENTFQMNWCTIVLLFM